MQRYQKKNPNQLYQNFEKKITFWPQNWSKITFSEVQNLNRNLNFMAYFSTFVENTAKIGPFKSESDAWILYKSQKN